MAEGLFPAEVASNVPRITMTGTDTVHVEQHQGLVAYQEEEVAFRTSRGIVKVQGSGLRFKLYTAGEAVLMGNVRGVTLEGNGGKGA